MTVHEVETRISAAEITEWMAYFTIQNDIQQEEKGKAKAMNELKARVRK